MNRSSILVATLAVLMTACSKPPSDGEPVEAARKAAGAVDPNSPEFKKKVAEHLAEMKREDEIREEAPWFGRTGLDDDTERELPHYLRRELGKPLSAPGSLRAAELVYVGAFVEGSDTVHYWQLPAHISTTAFAYVLRSPTGPGFIGWGDRKPAR